MWVGEAADRRRIGEPPGAPREPGLGGNRMKKLTGSQLFGGANEGAQNQGDK